jgi:[CysO sulfur-carrier protein]-S-L-cysteine hydrolase
MRLPKDLADEIVAHAREDSPNECCGMLGGNGDTAATVYRARNAEASPLRYSLDAQDQFRIMKEMEERGEELIGIYHSHTGSPAYPSQTDVNLATYPDAVYVIVSLKNSAGPEIKGFWIRDGRIDESELAIT